jgi:hypothetical protein
MDEFEAILETGGAAAVEIAASALAERGVAAQCPNCNHPLIGPYCAICGQPHNTHRRTLGHLLHDFFKDLVSFDSRILRTARALLIQPGELPKSFREGRTQRYMPAVRLYLFVSLAFFLFLSATGIALMQFSIKVETTVLTHDKAGHVVVTANGKSKVLEGLKSDAQGNISLADPHALGIKIPGMKADGSVDNKVTAKPVFLRPVGDAKIKLPAEVRKELDGLRKEAMATKEGQSKFMKGMYGTLARLETDPAALNGPLMTWIPRILFVLVPLYAVLLAAFYWRRRKEFFYVDHLVFSLTMHTFLFVVLIAAAAAQFVPPNVLAVAVLSVISLYLFLSLKFFYGQGWVVTALKFVGITFLYTALFLVPALAAAILASLISG